MHLSQLHKKTERGEFSIRFVKENGELIRIDRCICTSFHSSGTTMNVMVCESGEVRKIVRISILSINNEEVYL